jgi:hypothetical protein
MNWLPTDTHFGHLELCEVFVEYDGPRLFTCQSVTDQTFLAAWAEEGEEKDLWLYLPLSQSRLATVRSGGISVRDAYLHPEGFLYLAELPHDGNSGDEVRPIRPSEVADEWLPEVDFLLELETPTAAPALGPAELERLAKQEARTRLDLRVHLPKYFRTEAPTRKVGQVLISLQGLLENIGALEMQDQPPQAGALPIEVVRSMSSSVVALSAASFVVGVASADGPDLFGGSPFAQATKRLVGLLSNQVDEETVSEEVLDLKPRGARSYRRFIKELADTNGDVTIVVGSSAFGNLSASMGADRLRRLSELLDQAVAEEPTEIRARMILVAGDTEKMRFGLRDIETDALFQGTVSPAAAHQVSRATLKDEYEVILSELATSDSATGEVKYAYALEQLIHVVDIDANGTPN